MVNEEEVKIYEIDTKHFDVNIKKGATIVRVVVLKEYQQAILQAKRERTKKILDLIKNYTFNPPVAVKMDNTIISLYELIEEEFKEVEAD